MVNKAYFKKTEDSDYEELLHFNDKVKCFDEIKRMEELSETDASAATKTRRFSIELKGRNQVVIPSGGTLVISGCSKTGKPYTCDTIYIEGHKAASLYFDRILGLEPLYMNFMQDGCTVIFNLDTLKHRPACTKEMNIKSDGYGKFEVAKRFQLELDDAIIYDKYGKVVKYPNQQ